MRKLLPDTIFGRLIFLVILAFLFSQIIILILHAASIGHTPPPHASPHLLTTGDAPHPPRVPWADILIDQAVQLCAVLIAATIGARMISRPIADLAKGARMLGENLYASPIVEQGSIETRNATRVLNQIQTQLQQQIKDRQHTLAALSHDLRTPLTRLKLRAEQIPEPALRQKMRDDMQEMAQMCDASLDYLRGTLQQEDKQMLDVQSLLEAIAEDERDCGHSVTLIGIAQPLPAYPVLLRRSLQNIIDNGIRYGNCADICVQDTPDCLHISICDQGPGVPDAQIAAIFEPFVRLEASRNKATGGMGLGLTIARDGIERHGGSLSISNRPQGGLRVDIHLPRP